MMKFLLALLFCTLANLLMGQSFQGADSFTQGLSIQQPATKITIYPNPATDFIRISNDDAVSKVVIYNMVGREVRAYEAVRGEQYRISDLSNGMYLVQLYGQNKKILTTQRFQKR
jgi:hypothetical protein